MTNQVDAGGPSLLQARKTRQHQHQHQHLHNHQHLHCRLHSHTEARQPQGGDSAAPHIRSPPPSDNLHERQVVVVQTVSVVHYVDASGAVTSVSTIRSDPVTPSLLGIPPGVTAVLSAVGDALPSVSLSGLLPDLNDGAPSTTASAQTESSVPVSASPETLTSAPFSSSSAFPTLSTGIFNSSSTHIPSLFSNSTVGLFSNTTKTAFSSTFSSKTSSSSSTPLTTTNTFDVATLAVAPGSDATAGAGSPAAAPATPEPTADSGPGLTPATRNAVVGGVVGSVAGIAIIVLALLYLLKWRKQHARGIMLLGDGDSTAHGRGLTYGTSPGGGRGGMMERAAVFAVPAALAKLTGNKQSVGTPAASATQEKGFYRVSGRKLISVLESGGDGYSDPSDSIGGGTSYYRDSQAFLDSSNLQPLQLGSPMRPQSGVPVFRDGPQRTATHGQAPSPSGHRPSAFPTTLPVPDALGRSFASRDGSRGSGSRFTEDT
ncbi:hypothetical protein MFIFM68171_04493 [Madurella fahalii]|uniref:Uncharacterized protein n=1 Tax=Madurella fahalii TaxID=1157608 RepID=A0ABQ0G937_9PEZI